jgi:hypothetical protein
MAQREMSLEEFLGQLPEKHLARQQYERLQRTVKMAKDLYAAEGPWYWMDDEENWPESLICPVLMSADTCRRLIAEALGEGKTRSNTEGDHEMASLRDEQKASLNFEFEGTKYLITARAQKVPLSTYDASMFATFSVFVEKEDVARRKFWVLITDREERDRVVARFVVTV